MSYVIYKWKSQALVTRLPKVTQLLCVELVRKEAADFICNVLNHYCVPHSRGNETQRCERTVTFLQMIEVLCK